MRQVYIVSLATLLPMLLLGCGAQQSETSSSNPQLVPSSSPSAQIPSIPTNPGLASGATPGSTKVAQGSIGLIPSTNPEVRRKSVATGGRNDPFRSLATQPEIEVTAVAPGVEVDAPDFDDSSKSSGSNGSNLGSKFRFPGLKSSRGGQPTAKSNSGIAFAPPSSRSSNPAPAIGGTNATGKSGHPLVKPTVPYVPPSTDLAKAVEVTGIVQTGQTLVAIVRDPQEPTSRNVQAGERLSNGQVLVKRISVGIAGSPVIVLEQNGVEVIKTLGGSASITS